jgi:hypothetical protein
MKSQFKIKKLSTKFKMPKMKKGKGPVEPIKNFMTRRNKKKKSPFGF